MAILDKRLGKLHNKLVMYVLGKWTNRPMEKLLGKFMLIYFARFPDFDAVS